MSDPGLSSRDFWGRLDLPDLGGADRNRLRTSVWLILSSEMAFDQELLSLPHGAGFRFIDRIDELEPGVGGAGRYLIKGTEPFLAGHFPGRPLWPGVLMIEAIAQLGGIVGQCDPEHAMLGDLRLTSVRNAKIMGTVGPGGILEVKASVEGRMGNLIQVKGEVSCGGRKLAEAVVMLSGDAPDESEGRGD